MTYKKIFIIVLVAIAAFYVFKVKGYNHFETKIRGDITLCQLNGQKKALDEYAGENGTLIFFMSTWCPHCAEEIERAKPLAEFFRLRKINVLIGMYGPDRDVIHSWVAKQDIPWDWTGKYRHAGGKFPSDGLRRQTIKNIHPNQERASGIGKGGHHIPQGRVKCGSVDEFTGRSANHRRGNQQPCENGQKYTA